MFRRKSNLPLLAALLFLDESPRHARCKTQTQRDKSKNGFKKRKGKA